jgi:diguanylate cyclase (GGDEF)-like protein
LIDVDGLKAADDALGHAAGDALIAAVAERLERGTRGGDALARVGGDEFVLLCPGVDEPAAAALAFKLEQSVEAEPVSYRQNLWKLPLTVR